MITICRICFAFAFGLSTLSAADDAFWTTIESPRDDRTTRPSGLSIEGLMERYEIAGLSVAVLRNGAIDSRGYGVSDVETGTDVNRQTRFQAASISKSVNAFAVKIAIEKGLFGADDDINAVLERWHLERDEGTGAAPATPHLLMCHAAGIHVRSFPGYAPGETVPDVVGVLSGNGNTPRVVIASPPGSEFRYAGGGTVVLQLALEDATGRTYSEILQDWVLSPLGMTLSSYEQPPSDALIAECARAHDRGLKRMDAPWHIYPEYAAAGLWTTPADLCRFAEAVQDALAEKEGALVSRDSVIPMLSPQPTGSYAEGFEVTGGNANVGEFSHSGGNWGFSCQLTAVKSAPYACAIMTNAGSASSVMNEIIQRVRIADRWPTLEPEADE